MKRIRQQVLLLVVIEVLETHKVKGLIVGIVFGLLEVSFEDRVLEMKVLGCS